MGTAGLRYLGVILLLCLLMFQGNEAHSCRNGPDGFRGIKWGTDINKLKGMKLIEDEGDNKYYERTSENMQIGEAVVDEIVYCFHKRRLFCVLIRFRLMSNFVALKEAFFQKYGPGIKMSSHEHYGWGSTGSAVQIDLKYNKTSEKGRIVFNYRPIAAEQNAVQERNAKKALRMIYELFRISS